MKSFASVSLLLTGLLFAGCASNKSEFGTVPGPSGGNQTAPAAPVRQPAAAQSAATQPIVTPAHSLAGKVVRYNDVGRFVVLSFPEGQLPKAGTTLFLYRNGLKVAEIKVSGPETEHFTVADVVSGNAQAGDEARSQ